MEKIAYSLLMILVLIFFYFDSVSSAIASQRNLWQFKTMINYKGYSSLDYNGYGCWCGYGNHGSLTIDATDMCCKIHDQCYGKISGGFFGCSPKLVTYDWKRGSNKTIECTDVIDTCDRNACECDKAAVDCFEEHRSTYHTSLRSLGSKTHLSVICNP